MIIKRTPGVLAAKAKPKPKYKISVFKQLTLRQERQSWMWHLLSLTGKEKIVATSGEPFYSRSNAIRAARRMQKLLAVETEFWFEVAS